MLKEKKEENLGVSIEWRIQNKNQSIPWEKF